MSHAGRSSGPASSERWCCSPDAPEKYLAANELTRTYDLQNDRFEMRERRNMLFPFLAPFGHSFASNVNGLDGTVDYDRNGETVR